MKKVLALMLALGLIAGLATVSFASHGLNPGDVVYFGDDDDDDDYYTSSNVESSVPPGTTAWIYLEDYDKDVDDPKSVKLDDVSVWDPDEDDEIKLISVDRKPVKKKTGSNSGDRAWFARMTVRSVAASKYPKDGYDVDDFTITYTSYAGGSSSTESVDVNLSTIEYDESDDEFTETAKLFEYDKDDDVDIDLPDDAGNFKGTARKDFEVVASMDTKVNNSILTKYPNADIQFFNGNGAVFQVSSGKMTFYANSGDYLYSVGSDNKLTDISNTWNSTRNAFVVTTNTIGRYILSDTKLSGASVSEPVVENEPKQNEYIGSTPLPSGNSASSTGSQPVITNPNTGAAA